MRGTKNRDDENPKKKRKSLILSASAMEMEVRKSDGLNMIGQKRNVSSEEETTLLVEVFEGVENEEDSELSLKQKTKLVKYKSSSSRVSLVREREE